MTLTIFFFGYILFEVPSNIMVRKKEHKSEPFTALTGNWAPAFSIQANIPHNEN
jgi:hypothetical protein